MKCFFTDKGITVDPSGDIVPCCRFNKSNLEYQNIDEVTDLKTIPQSKIFLDTRETLANDKWYKGCSRCERDEEMGIFSRRTIYEQEKYNNFRVIDVALGNVCNLKCIMCNNKFSTQWHNDQKVLTDAGFENYDKPHQYFSKTISKENIDKIIDWIEKDDSHVEVEFKGGEPLAIPITEYFFEKLSLVKNKIVASITTNGTFCPTWFEEFCQKDNIQVMLNVSIDGVDEVYDYVRGTKQYNFFAFEKNLEKFKQLPLKLTLNYVVQNVNVHHLRMCIDRYKDIGVNVIFLRNPTWLQVWNMPEEAKQTILEDLNNISTDSFNYHKIKAVIDNINNKCNDTEYTEFIKFTALLDRERNRSLPKIAPHLFNQQSLNNYKKVKGVT